VRKGPAEADRDGIKRHAEEKKGRRTPDNRGCEKQAAPKHGPGNSGYGERQHQSRREKKKPNGLFVKEDRRTTQGSITRQVTGWNRGRGKKKGRVRRRGCDG